MTLIDSHTKIPGISDNSQLIQWIDENEIKHHPNLTIEQSDMGGIGLFFTKSDHQEQEDFEVLRIPRSSVFDMLTLLVPLEQIKLRDSTYTGKIPIKESELIMNFLSILEPQTETFIIVTYFLAFKAIETIRLQFPHSDYYINSPSHKFDLYLSILSHTFTLQCAESTQHQDQFINHYISMCKKMKNEYESVVEQMKIIYQEGPTDFEKLLTFEDCFQIFQAIRSRTLEIPRDIESDVKVHDEQTEIVDEVDRVNRDLSDLALTLDVQTKKLYGNNNENYVIDITLVPILDFANHSHNSNGYFDVDRSNSDVLLKLDKKIISSLPDKFEITISYSPEDYIQDFIYTYGFLPKQGDHFQIIELKFDELDKYIEDGNLLCKWLRILPQVQIILNNEEIYINLNNNNLPILFIEGLSFNMYWEDLLLDHFRTFNNIPQDYDTEIDDEELQNMFAYQEANYDFINGIDPIGLLYNGKPVITDLSEILTITGNQDNYDKLVLKTLDFTIKYIKDRVDLIKPVTKKTNNFDEMIQQYDTFKRDVINRMIEKYNKDPTSLILPDSIAKPEWEVYYRTPARELKLEQQKQEEDSEETLDEESSE
ncbi:Cytochrome c lysine N-methyltransferase 1 [Spathaspora sp. JA1]|nr:Cytochrome c lysine N-methyltransferase 1 [Spathaspora sp. JA1]